MKQIDQVINVFLVLGLLIGVASYHPISAHQAADGGSQASDLTNVIDEILDRRGLKSVDQIICSDLSDEEWEQLGEAVMDVAHPDIQQHSAMDEMMGGEGSESLRQSHIHMGQSYLGCFLDDVEPTGMISGMMGGLGSMGFGMSGWGWIGAVVFWVVVISGGLLLVKWLVSQTQSNQTNKSALDILKERYARGEIDRGEYEDKRKDLAN